jgi:DNA-binding MarR family transcriptional regulator
MTPASVGQFEAITEFSYGHDRSGGGSHLRGKLIRVHGEETIMQERPLGLMIWLRMARFVQRSNHISTEYLSQWGLTVAQFEVLSTVRAYQPVTQTDLAARLTVSCGGISRMLTRLEAENLITRSPEWKTNYISLTQTGREKLRAAYPGQVELQASMFDDVLDETEQKQLYALLRKVHKNSLKKQAPTTSAPEPSLDTQTMKAR